MGNLLGALGTFLVIFGVTTVIIGIIRHFFPMVEPLFPDSFKKPLSFRFGSYYLLAGLVLLVIST